MRRSRKAKELLHTYAKRACELDSAFGCWALGTSYKFAHTDFAHAKKYYQKLCALQDTMSCYHLGLWEMQGLGGMLKDAKKALEHIKLACESDVKTNCKALQKMDSKKQGLYKCESNTPIFASSACHSVGGIYEHGFDTLKSDMNQALKYYKKACDAGLDMACSSYNNVQQKIK